MKYRESNRCEFRAKLAEMFAKICILATLPHLGKMRVLGGVLGGWGKHGFWGFLGVLGISRILMNSMVCGNL